MPKRIIIAGYFGLQNTGDEAILSAMFEDLTQFQHDLEFTVLSYDPGFISSEYSIHSVSWLDWPKVSEAIAISDLVLLGGGGLLHDYDRLDLSKILISQKMGFESVVSVPILANQMSVPYMLYAIGVGPLHSDLSKDIVREIVKRASVCTVRDHASKRLLEELGSPADNIQVTADPAFGIEPISTTQVKSIFAAEFGSDLIRPQLGVSLRSWDYQIRQEQWLQEIIVACDQYLDHTDGTLLFIPFHNNEILQSSDRSVSLMVRERMRNRDRAFVLASDYQPGEICGVIGNCDYILGMRLHSLIFASKMFVPFVGLSYDPKVSNFLEEIGLPANSIDFKQLKGDDLAARLINLQKERDSIRRVLENSIQELTLASRKNAKLAIEWIENHVDEKGQRREDIEVSSTDCIRQQAVDNFLVSIERFEEPGKSNNHQLVDPEISDVEQDELESLIQEPYFGELVGILEENADSKGVIIYPPTIDWGFMFQRPQQMARSLAKDGYLFFYCTGNITVDNVVGFEKVSDNLYLCNVPLTTFNLISQPILYLGTARHSNIVGLFNEPLVIYDFCDDLRVSSVSQEDHVETLKRADIVMASSQKLYKDVTKYKSDALLIPNAADFEYIQSSKKKSKKRILPHWESIISKGGLVIGYSGALANWLDYELISRIAREKPDSDVVLIGVDYDGSLEKSGVLNEPNVYWFGMMEYEDLIRSLWYFDVAMIPFLLNEITVSTSPIKLFEYLACGKPVVSTALPECMGKRGVLIGETHDDFVAQLDSALESRHKKRLISEVMKEAKNNTWDGRVIKLSPRLSELNREQGIYVSLPGMNNLKLTGRGDVLEHSLRRINFLQRKNADLSGDIELAFKRLKELEILHRIEKEKAEQFLSDLSQLQHTLDKAQSDLRLAKNKSSEAELEVSKTREQLNLSNLEVDELRTEMGNIEKNNLVLREKNAQLEIERDSLRTTLTKLHNTTGVRLLGFYWSIMRKLMPVGSRRRLWYFRIRNSVASTVKSVQRVGRGIYSKESASVSYQLRVDSAITQETKTYQEELQHFIDTIASFNAEKVFTIFSPVAFLENEGQRSTNLTLEMMKLNYAVIFVYWRWSTNETRQQYSENPNLFQIPIDIFIKNPDLLFRKIPSSNQRILLVEFPYPGFFEAIAVAHASGWITLYDIIDDWEEFARVGQAEWFDMEFEKHLVTTTDAVVVVNHSLEDKFTDVSTSGFCVVPNGVSQGIKSIQEEQKLERGKITLGYYGYLSEAWFDWDLIKKVGENKCDWRIYIIGYGDQFPKADMPNNVVFLGKMPRSMLSAYAANWDVGIVPFKEGGVACNADPIKIYEYIAMDLPVVGTGIQPPIGGERYVRIARGSSDFTEQVIKAIGESQAFHSERQHFIQKCTWDKRLKRLFELVDQGEQRIGEKLALFMSNDQT